jgi:hypothetical protein
MMRNLSNLNPSEVNHMFRGSQKHINGALTSEQKALITPLKRDVVNVEKAVQQKAMQPGFITKVARLFARL